MTRKVFAYCLIGLLTVSGCGFGGPKKEKKAAQTVEQGDLKVEVVETGTLQAVKLVEIKSRVSGRVKKLYVDEGDHVTAGQLIAEIDPQETQLQVDQNQAQIRGAMAATDRQSIEIAQRKVTAANALAKAKSTLRQTELELKIQPGLTQASVVSAKSAYEAAKQAYDQLIHVTQPNERTATNVAVKDAQNNLDNAKRELDRQSNLLSLGYVSVRDVENARLQVQLAETKLQNVQDSSSRLSQNQTLSAQQAEERMKQAKADYDRATANTIQDSVKREQYQRAVKDVSDAEAQLRDVAALEAARRQQLAQVQQLQSVLSDGQRQLRETRIVAPISGLITSKLVQEGELVASLNSFSAGTTIVQLEDRSKMIVKLNINEIDVAKLSLGTKAKVRVDAFPTEELVGTVTKIAPASVSSGSTSPQSPTSDAVVKYKVEVSLDVPSDKLKTGMSAKCTMIVLDKKDILRVPLDFVGQDDKGSFIVLAPKNPKDPKDKGKQVPVVVGDRSATFVEIKSGATKGQEIVRPEYKGPKRKGMFGGPDDSGE